MADVKISELPELETVPDGAFLAVVSGGTTYKAQKGAIGGGGTAEEIEFDNTESGLDAEDVQAAIDELAEGIAGSVEMSDLAPVAALTVLANATNAGVSPTAVAASTASTVFGRTASNTLGFFKLTDACVDAGTLSTSKLVSQSDQTVLANTSGGSASPSAVAAQTLRFVNATSGAGSIGLKVAPEAYAAVTSLATADNVNADLDPSENGFFTFTVSVLVKRLTGLEYRKVAAVISARRVAGTMTIEGTQSNLEIGATTTGITITLTATSGSLRVNVANATGETVNGRIHVGWIREDLIT
jgi:hypothetical protein